MTDENRHKVGNEINAIVNKVDGATFIKILKHLENIVEIISSDNPTAEGTWTVDIDKNRGFDWRRFYCSACGDWNGYGKSKYCPWCGARIDRKAEEPYPLGREEEGTT